MPVEEHFVTKASEAIAEAGRECCAGLHGVLSKLEAGHLSDQPYNEDWGLIEAWVEDVAVSKHFTKKHGKDAEAYSLFKAAAKSEFFGTGQASVDAARDLRFAEERYFFAHFTGKFERELVWERAG